MNSLKYQILTLLMLIVSVSCDETELAPLDEIDIPEGYSLIWQDEFNNDIIDLNSWAYETGDGTEYGLPAGWGNNELQIYSSNPDNSYIGSDGEVSSLVITALEDGAGGFTSAKLVTNDLLSIRFGRIDVKAKMPKGQGIWPAIWMLGDNNDLIDWPGCGEIDIAEVIGSQPSTYYTTLHFTNGENKHEEIQEAHILANGSFSDSYHVFTLDWTPEMMTFLLDGVQIQQVPLEEDMKEFLRSFYLVLNVAVGGYWPGNPDNSTLFPQAMNVDYIRIFSQDDFTPPEAPVLDIEEETIGQIIEPNIGDNAIKEGFTDLGNLSVVVYGGGGEPTIATSETVIDGDLSLAFDFPGGSWGGGYIELEETKNLSNYSLLKFSLNTPPALHNAEIKLESPSTNKAIYLKDYSATDVGNGYYEYTIPLSDLGGLDLTEVSIPFSMWNPQDLDANFIQGSVLIDNLHFAN